MKHKAWAGKAFPQVVDTGSGEMLGRYITHS